MHADQKHFIASTPVYTHMYAKTVKRNKQMHTDWSVGNIVVFL